jgi:Enoyl-(Acyl carrier protein) reductase
MAHTGAARAAVEAITRELAFAYGPRGVAVIAVALGRFDTESLRKYPAELWKSAAASVPVQRLGSVEEYGWLIALLATPLGVAVGFGRHARRRARQLGRSVAPNRIDARQPGADRRARTGRLIPAPPPFPGARLPSGHIAGEVLTAAREPSKL